MAQDEYARTGSVSVVNPASPGTDEGDGNDPSVPSAAYERMRPRWEKCRDVMLGTEAIRDGGTTYLPQYSQESDADYEVRKVLAAFYNGFARTVNATVGMLCGEEPALGEDVPDYIGELWENVDAAGTHGAVFARRLTTAGMVDSHAGILVEFSKNPEAGRLSVDEERRRGLRPYFLLFKADDVFRPLYAVVNGVKTLVLLILRETVTERKGKFGVQTVEQYRVYTNDNGVISYELWRAAEGGGTPTQVEGPNVVTNQDQIPWAPFVAGEEINPGEYKPPLMDLADLNIQYHNSLTNHLSLQSLAYVPTPVRIGAQPDANGDYPTLTLGPRNTIEAPAQEGVSTPVYWLSPPVDVLDAGERTLQSTLAAMATLGASFLTAETRAAETAEGKRIDSAASRATLATVSRALKDCFESALGFMAKYLKLEGGGSITLAADFTGEPPDPQMVAVMLQAVEFGLMLEEEFRHYLLTGQLPEGFDPQDMAIGVAREISRISRGGLPASSQSGDQAPAQPDAPAKPTAEPAAPAGPDGMPETLNGAQIQAAVTVLQAVATGEIVEVPAVELLVAVGIARDRATTMVREQARKAVPPAQAVTGPAEPPAREEAA